MDQRLRQDIIEVLTEYLNRPPNEDEISNAPTDLITMGKVRDKQILDIQRQLGV